MSTGSSPVAISATGEDATLSGPAPRHVVLVLVIVIVLALRIARREYDYEYDYEHEIGAAPNPANP